MKDPERTPPDELRTEYVRADFAEMVRGKYAGNTKLINLVKLDPDLAAAFPTDRAVNDALRMILNARKTAVAPD